MNAKNINDGYWHVIVYTIWHVCTIEYGGNFVVIMGGGGGGLSLSDTSHKEGNVPLYIDRELLHLGNELRSVGVSNGAVYLEVKEVLTCECMVFITNYLFVAESAEAVMSWGINNNNILCLYTAYTLKQLNCIGVATQLEHLNLSA